MTASLENRVMLLIENCRPAGDNISWTMPENRGDLFGSKSNSDLWPFRFLSISTDGINTELTKPLCGGKRQGYRYTTTKQAARLEKSWSISDRIGRGCAMDYVQADPLLIDPVFVDIKALDYPLHCGSDKKIRLAGGTMEYCQAKMKVVAGEDDHPYLLHIVWENSVTIFEWKINLTKVYEAWKADGSVYKAFNIRKHGKSFDLEWKPKSLLPWLAGSTKMQHHARVMRWLVANCDCTYMGLYIRQPKLKLNPDASWLPLM